MENTKALKPVEKRIEVVTALSINPKEFYKDRDGLRVWSDFTGRIVNKADEVEAGTKYIIASFDLVEYANDAQIEAELPEKHLFNETEVSGVIADIISKQPKGEAGTLQNNGYANLFYTPDFVVSVRWHGFDGYWFVFTCERDDYRWGGGSRVFSPATDS